MPLSRAASRRNPQALGRIASPKAQSARLPAPKGGVSGRVSVGSGDLNYAIYAYNMVPARNGLQVRKGYREWIIGVEDVATQGVTHLIPFDAIDDANKRLFAVTNEGVWDCSTEAGTPTKSVAFSTTTDAAGYGVSQTVVTATGEEIIFFTDSANGLFRYTRSTDVWAAPTGGDAIAWASGKTNADPFSVTKHKLRVWFAMRDSGTAQYLGVDAISGAATEFDFGSKFARGGTIVGMFNWTLDGGDGVDDYFVVVGSEGDVLVYRGTDPSAAATWSLVGNYYIGPVPPSANVGYQYGGELYLLSTFGLIAMSELLRGVNPAAIRDTSLAYRVADFLQADMSTLLNEPGWSMQFCPGDDMFLICPPPRTDGSYIQYAMNVTEGGWGLFRELPALYFATYNNMCYFGTLDGRVMIMDVFLDNVTIADPAPAQNGEPINFSVLFNYSDFGSGGVFKRIVTVRPDMYSVPGTPTYQTKILYDYRQTEFVTEGLNNPANVNALWDSATWDAAIWNSGTDLPEFNSHRGASGYGRTCAFAMQGQSVGETVLISVDMAWLQGGLT